MTEETSGFDRPARGAAAIGALVRRALVAAGDLVVPPCCVMCQTPLVEHHMLCAACWRQVRFIHPPVCDVTGIPLPYDAGGRAISAAAEANPPSYDRARAVAQHTGAMRRLIHQFKYGDRHDARTLLGRWLREAGRDLLPETDVIVPVPLSRMRLLSRRFNQAAMLGRELARQTGLPFDPHLLRRERFTASQVGKSRNERQANVAGAFRVPPRGRARLAGRRVLLIDDVITTGATAGACARALKQGGATRVNVLALGLVTGEDIISA